MCGLFVFTRLKTCPPNTLTSDYSWSDNEYRKYDIIKLKAFNDYINTNKEFFKSYKFNINNLLCDDREFPFYDIHSNTIKYELLSKIKEYLNERN
jgi:hypothetical protein